MKSPLTHGGSRTIGRQRRVQDGGRLAALKGAGAREQESRARVRGARDSEKSTESGGRWQRPREEGARVQVPSSREQTKVRQVVPA